MTLAKTRRPIQHLPGEWTFSFLREYSGILTPRSLLSYRSFLLRAARGDLSACHLLELELRSPARKKVWIRELGSDVNTFSEIFLEQAYKSVRRLVPDCRTLIDLGANIGLASLYLGAHYNCDVFSVEPNPESFMVLQRNLQSSLRSRCLMGGVWSHATRLGSVGRCSDPHFSGFQTIEDEKGPIRGFSMEELIAESQFPIVDLLKIDVEGAESKIFSGTMVWLKRVRAIAIEFHGNSRQDIGFDRILTSSGFQILESGVHTTIAAQT